MMNTVRIGSNYFQSEKRAYSHWYSALFREYLQNAKDSIGCSRIEFNFEELENSTKITIIDNGQGMSRDTLDNVFLIVGETTKSGIDDNGNNFTGGYGIARNLILFAQKNYLIKSHSYIVKGSGANYEIEDNSEFVRGCIFVIEAEKHDWEFELRKVLDRSHLSQNIYINGERYNSNPERARLVRELSFGKVYVNKSADPLLIVRVNGLFMHSKYISAKARVFVEINSDVSKDTLTSNRDGLQYSQSQELDQFLNELAADTKSALSDKTKKFILFADKTKCFLAKKKNQIKEIATDMGETLGGVVKTILNAPPEEMGGGAMAFGGGATSNFSHENYEAQETPHTTYSFKPAIDPVLASMILVNESESAETVKIAKLYDPQVMSETGTRFKLLKQWAKINEIILDIYTEWRGGEYAWAVGFLFSDDAEAQLRTEENIRYILLNPLNNLGKMKYSVNDKNDIFALMVLSSHEISHLSCAFHSEEYASIFTDLMKKVLARSKEIFNAVKLIK